MLSRSCCQPQIHAYQAHYVDALVDVFCRAVHQIDERIYSEQQKRAWAPIPADKAFWQRRFATTKPFVALLYQRPVGFLELDAQGHIDSLYVDPDLQQQGIGRLLLTHAIDHAKQQPLPQLTVDASRCAKPLLEQQGFVEQHTQMRRSCGTMLVNHVMQKVL
ncbi:histone acetyltransferase [Bacterioplanes sanyensis]|uniref:Histone acetyltransferase n=1 Tax=Bacterioplanes sanyensis TaxID=1249553 RepID=A0A222FIN3_9GAMM|nr:GNAT family N-acetyltransferase [Bacterioplanes sanyensis]ASP38512.1 histone acetyltransferase [Bacterioplanes sanyensis]